MKTLLFAGLGKVTVEQFSNYSQSKSECFQYVKDLVTAENLDSNSSHTIVSSFSVAEGIACAQLYKAHGGSYAAVSGYSVGQMAALYSAGILDWRSALELAVKRSLLMKKYMPLDHGMLSVIGPTHDDIKTLLAEAKLNQKIFFSTINSLFNHTLCGLKENLNAFSQQLTKLNFQVQLLDVEGSWHSPFLKDSIEEYQQLLDRYEFHPPTCFYVCNYSGAGETDPEIIKSNLLGHMCSPVLWHKSIQTLVQFGTTHFLECGQGDQLKKMLFYMRTKPCFSMTTNEDITKCVAL